MCFLTVFPLEATTARTAEIVSLASADYRLHLFNTYTQKRLDIVYRGDNNYFNGALLQLDNYLKDRRTGETHHYDPRLFDLLHDLTAKLGKPNGEIDVLCGYRSPWSNNFLRRHGYGAALHSLHMQAKAIDIRIPGISTTKLRDAALALHRGGVGYYAKKAFVHVDVGRFRHWRG